MPRDLSINVAESSMPSMDREFCVCMNTSGLNRGLHGYEALQEVLPNSCVPLLVGGLQPLSMTVSRS